ncbi:MAG: NUDIX hydrolase [Nocardioides sp.]
MTSDGTQIILLNGRQQVLMYLRDDKSEIPYPGMLEPGESPAACIRREIAEEIGITLDPDHVRHIRTRDLHYGVGHTFFAPVEIEIEIDDVVLTEGQRLSWFTESEAATTKLAYEDNQIPAEFFASGPPVGEGGRPEDAAR